MACGKRSRTKRVTENEQRNLKEQILGKRAIRPWRRPPASVVIEHSIAFILKRLVAPGCS